MLRIISNPSVFDTSFFKKDPLSVAIIDADLLDNGTTCPNLALLKISAYLKANGHTPRLICSYSELEPSLFSKGAEDYDTIIISQVFNFTKRPPILEKLISQNKAFYGGTGFFEINAPHLPQEVEHSRPDYNLYNEYISLQPGTPEQKKKKYKGYTQFSIGFTTRGCFRQCPFCVNRTYKKVQTHSPVKEFLDTSRPYIWLLDDNFMASPKKTFFQTLDELNATGKRFQFKQGLDIRLMTDAKAQALAKSRYWGDYIFAFDHIDAPTVKATIKGLQTWRKYSQASTKLYILSAYESQDAQDIESIFYRINICIQYKCLPYIMRYENYKKSPWKQLYTCLARWCNQPALFKKKSFRQFMSMKENSRYTIHQTFEKQYPEIASKYYDISPLKIQDHEI